MKRSRNSQEERLLRSSVGITESGYVAGAIKPVVRPYGLFACLGMTLIALLIGGCQIGASKPDIYEQTGTQRLRPLIGAETSQNPSESVRNASPAYRMGACELYSEIGSNTGAASSKYGGKVVEVTGEVQFYSGSVVNVGRCGNGTGHINCSVRESDRGPMYSQLSTSSTVTVKGRLPERLGPAPTGPLIGCVILSVRGS